MKGLRPMLILLPMLLCEVWTIGDDVVLRAPARARILGDRHHRLIRRRRYSYKSRDGYVVHHWHGIAPPPANPCAGWTRTNAYQPPCPPDPCLLRPICVQDNCNLRCVNGGAKRRPHGGGAGSGGGSGGKRRPAKRPATGGGFTGRTIYDTNPGRGWLGPKKGCNCSQNGSELLQCDIVDGQCRCKPNYVGRTCDRCKDGYWDSKSGTCKNCSCDKDGALDQICDDETSRCKCKYGIGGDKCNVCLDKFYHFSAHGCRECEPCNREGHVCDPDTGKCVCPPLTRGNSCEQCLPNTWGYEPQIGCKPCNCSVYGSNGTQCNLKTGDCYCRQGYAGIGCNRCDYGYFGYPRCRRCSCSVDGTDPDECRKNGLCDCHKDTGRCNCKINVVGQRCDECKEGTFGLHQDNIDGCTQCFCFGRAATCTDAGLTWDHIRLKSGREISVSKIPETNEPSFGVSRNEITITEEKFHIIPGSYKNVSVESFPFDAPLYWKLPKEFYGDRILSYGGYIRFVSETVNSTERLPMDNLRTYPVVQLEGNGIVLEHTPPMSVLTEHEVRLHESFWTKKINNRNRPISRETLMIVLQNVTRVLIRATESRAFSKVVLSEVTWDTAIEVLGNPPPYARGVEKCECPKQYNSSSCQNPSIGFFRWYNPSSANSTIYIIGEAKECECNGRSNVCDIETGHCLACTENTSGKYCERCAVGFYGDPMLGVCEPCPCPDSSRNFAVSCAPKPGVGHHFQCHCKPGYTGHKCERCSVGFYGQPNIHGGSCKPCNCNPEGVDKDQTCNTISGHCKCKIGITGPQCSRCEKPRHVLQNSTCTRCDQCTDWLLDDYEDLARNLSQYKSYIENASLQPPWEEYNSTRKRFEELSDGFDNYINSKDAAADFDYKPLDKLEKRVKVLKQRVKTFGNDTARLLRRNEAVKNNGTQYLNDISAINVRLNDLIKRLREFGNSTHLSKKEALKKARELLQQIKVEKHKINPDLSTLKKCQEVKRLVDDLIEKNRNTDAMNEELRKIRENLKFFAVNLDAIEKQNNETKTKNENNSNTIRSINETLIELRNRHSNLQESISAIKNDFARAENSLKGAQANVDRMYDDEEFSKLIQEVEEKEKYMSQINPLYAKQYVQPIQAHVAELEKRAKEYVDAFDKSTATINAYNASTAYGKISDRIDEAYKITQETATIIAEAEKSISPKGKDSLTDRTYLLIGDSDRLKERANNLNLNINELKEKIGKSKMRIQTLRDSIWGNGIQNKQQDAEKNDIKSQSNLSDLRNIIDEADKLSNKMRQIYKDAQNKDYDLQYKLRKQELDKIKKLHITEDQKRIINMTKELNNLVRTNFTLKIDNLPSNFKERTDKIAQQLELLRNTIKKGRELATGIQVALSGNCSRMYRLSLQPSVYTDVSVVFNRHKYSQNATIFYLEPQSNPNQFMAMEILNNELRFVFKVGSKTNVLTHNLKNDDSEESTSIEVTVERRGRITLLKMKKTNSGKEPKIHRFTDPEGVTVFSTGPMDRLYVGIIPDNAHNINNSELKAKTNLNSCLQSITFNKQKIGLWNFERQFSDRCEGCAISKQSTGPDPTYYFQGEGYANISKRQRRSTRDSIKIEFQLTTFDENSTILLAVDRKNDRSLSITLNKGHIVFKYTFDKHPSIILQTKHKYNNGRWIDIKVIVAFKNNILSAKLDVKNTTKSVSPSEIVADHLNKIYKEDLLQILHPDTDYFIGGIPPDYKYKIKNFSKILSTNVSLLGGIKSIYDNGKLINPLESYLYYGVHATPSQFALSFNKVWFEENGKLHLEEVRSKNLSSLHFMVRTRKENAILMLISKQLEKDKKNYCYISIENGRIRFEEKNESQGVIVLYNAHSKSINDNNFHFVTVQKNMSDNPKTELLVDGMTIRSVSGATISARNEKLSLHMGYIPEDFIEKEPNLSTLSFNGAIKDIMLDDEQIKFTKDSVSGLDNVQIGREGPEILDSAPLDMKMGDMIPTTRTNIDGCRKIDSYLVQASAVKLGDTLHESFIVHHLRPDNFWNKEFILEFDLRTFYPAGLLLITPPKTSKHYIMIDLKEGMLQLTLQLKRKKSFPVPVKVDDGKWHHVVIKSTKLKKRSILTVTVDDSSSKKKPLKIPKKLNVARRIYIGNVPKEQLVAMVNNINQFKGCIRDFKVNNVIQDLVTDQHNIGQCFPNVEKGSYFAGDAYAIYKNNFLVSKTLELSFEFRTSEQSGILLSVSNPMNRPALSVELYNGSVVMRTDAGDGEVSKVENGLDSPFSLCNNEWHYVTALYSSREMTINVDGVRRSWVRANGIPQDEEIESPLYIGGLPDGAVTGTLKTRENFKGCIRNIKIGEKIVDWIDMDELNQVLLNSCPVM